MTALRVSRFGVRQLIGGGWRRMNTTLPVLWPIWALGAAATTAAYAVLFNLADFFDGQPRIEYLLAFDCVGAAIEAIGYALVMPVVLGLSRTGWPMDRRRLRYAAVTFALAAAFNVSLEMAFAFMDTDPVVGQAIRLPLILIQLWIGGRLVLWQVGFLTRDRPMPFKQAWTAMAGATWRYMLAYLAVGAALIPIGWLLMAFYGYNRSPIELVLFGLLVAFDAAWSAAVAASLYRLRLGGHEEDLTAVFA